MFSKIAIPGMWWKLLTIAIMMYVITIGMLGTVPRLAILNETIRNLYFHVPMWFGMVILLLVSVINGIRYLATGNLKHDLVSQASALVGLLMGVLGIVTGMLWAKFTWGAYWSNDPKQNAAAVGILIYLAYFLLRGSIPDLQKRAQVSAVYNIFAYALFIPLLFILPRLTDSLHPGNGGNPGFNAYDLDNNMRLVFYPAVLGFTLMGWWLASVIARIEKIKLNRFLKAEKV